MCARAASRDGHGRRGRKGRQRQRGGESGGGSEGWHNEGRAVGAKRAAQLARCVDRACWNGVGAMRWFMVMVEPIAVEG